MRRLAAVVGVVVVLAGLAACGGDDEALGPTATLPRATTVPEATTTTDPYAVPEVIDEAYVNRVLAGLDQVHGDSIRIAMETMALPRDVVDRLKAISIGEDLEPKIQILQGELLGDRFAGLVNPPGNRVTSVGGFKG